MNVNQSNIRKSRLELIRGGFLPCRGRIEGRAGEGNGLAMSSCLMVRLLWFDNGEI